MLLPHNEKRLKISNILEMITEGTLYNQLNHVFNNVFAQALFPSKKEPLKISELDKFLVSGNMSRFDNLFNAMGIYQNYKQYTNSVIPEEDLLLYEIYEKFTLQNA